MDLKAFDDVYTYLIRWGTRQKRSEDVTVFECVDIIKCWVVTVGEVRVAVVGDGGRVFSRSRAHVWRSPDEVPDGVRCAESQEELNGVLLDLGINHPW